MSLSHRLANRSYLTFTALRHKNALPSLSSIMGQTEERSLAAMKPFPVLVLFLRPPSTHSRCVSSLSQVLRCDESAADIPPSTENTPHVRLMTDERAASLATRRPAESRKRQRNTRNPPRGGTDTNVFRHINHTSPSRQMTESPKQKRK